MHHDLSDLRRSEEELRYQAQHDALTGLLNRALLYDRLQVAINHAAHRRGRLAVLFVDLATSRPSMTAWATTSATC